VFPFQRDRHLIGTQDWEYKVGVGFTRGFAWGTGTFRLSGEYSGEEGKVDAGEYAFEYLKRLSPKWRVFAAIEGTQVDEVELITEVQWHFPPARVPEGQQRARADVVLVIPIVVVNTSP